MNKAGVMRIGAMLAVLTVLAGGFAALPYWTASAGDKTIFGFVQECGSSPPVYLDGVTVTLVDAQGVPQPGQCEQRDQRHQGLAEGTRREAGQLRRDDGADDQAEDQSRVGGQLEHRPAAEPVDHRHDQEHQDAEVQEIHGANRAITLAAWSRSPTSPTRTWVRRTSSRTS